MSFEPSSVSSQTPEAFYASAQIQRHKIEDATIAVRVFGQGPAVVLIHGFPVHGYTWRKLLPKLSEAFTCYVVDLPGLGDSDWSENTNFTLTSQAHRLMVLFELLQLNSYALIAHNTGATVARLVTLLHPQHVKKLVIINTEIPGHRPAWIPLYQQTAMLPGMGMVFRELMRSAWFRHSSLGMRQFYSDKNLLNASNLSHYLDPLTKSMQRVKGALRYLRGIEWQVVDSLREQHANIKVDTLFLWGADDTTFPVELGEEMSKQFGGATTFIRLTNASLMPHEEKPNEVLSQLVSFLA